MPRILSIAILVLLAAFSLPARGQVNPQKAPAASTPPTASDKRIGPLWYPTPVPPPPFDAKLAQHIHYACCSRFDHAQIQLRSGLAWQGRVIKVHDDSDSFEFRPRGTKMIVTFEYRELASVTRIPPNFEEGFVEGLAIVGLGAALVALSPVEFLIGLDCNFQCS